jgi:hypothetical protein
MSNRASPAFTSTLQRSLFFIPKELPRQRCSTTNYVFRSTKPVLLMPPLHQAEEVGSPSKLPFDVESNLASG